MSIWVRDWVYRVIKPFLTQLKNRLGNIKLVYMGGATVRFTNAEGVSNDILTNSVNKNGILRLTPEDACVNFNGDNVGYLYIELPPEVATYTMMQLNLQVYIYKGNKSFEAHISGYNHSTPYWYNVTARRKQENNVKDQFKVVRFARRTKDGGDPDNSDDKSKFMLILGEADTNWVYAKIAIMESVFSHQSATPDVWNTGWKIYTQDSIADDVEIDSVKNL